MVPSLATAKRRQQSFAMDHIVALSVEGEIQAEDRLLRSQFIIVNC